MNVVGVDPAAIGADHSDRFGAPWTNPVFASLPVVEIGGSPRWSRGSWVEAGAVAASGHC